jgi:hypothetical protein
MRPATRQKKLPRQEKGVFLVPGQAAVRRWQAAALPRQENGVVLVPWQAAVRH